jgi:PAS domain S-box-containing protein
MPYRGLVEQVPAVVHVHTNEPSPRTVYVSPQCEPVLGWRPDEVIADRDLWMRAVHPDDRERVLREWARAIRQQDRFESEYRWIRPGGDVIWIRDGRVPVRDERGDPPTWHGVLQDVTGSKVAEEALRQSASHYRFLVENVPAVVYMVAPDDDRRTLYVSPQVERALGYTRKEWLDQPDIWMELLHPDDREPTLAELDRHNETGEPWSREYRLMASDGRAVWFRDVANLVADEDGRASHWLGVQLDVTELKLVEQELRAARDELERRVQERTAELEEANELMALEIHERRRAEEELRATEHRYRTLAEQIPAVTYIWQLDHDDGAEPHFYTSPRIEQMLGFTVEEWNHPADFWMSRLHPDDRTAVIAASLRSEATGEPFAMDYRYLHKAGHIVWVHDEAVLLSHQPDGRPAVFQGVMMDITARKEAESRALDTELRYRSLAEQFPAIIYVHDLETDELTYASPQLTRMLGYTREDWRTTDRWLECVHPDDRSRVAEFAATLGVDGRPYAIEYRVLHRDGTVRWVRDQGVILSRDRVGRPSELQGLVLDVSPTRRAERDRRDAEIRYRSLVEQMPAITFIELPGGAPDEAHFTYVSPQVERVVGRSAEELIADPGHFGRMLHPEDRERVIAANARATATGEPFDEDYRIVRDDGGVVWLHSRSTLIRDDDGRPLFWHGLAIDVTEQRRAEASLRELEERYRQLEGLIARADPGVSR